MSITVIDVAREAGVSRTTVSNVFTGRAKFSEETRREVLAAAKKLGYKPNLAARSLITNKSYLDKNTLTNSPFYNIIIDGVYSVFRDEQYYDLMLFSIPRKESLLEASDWIDTRNVDGILAIGEYDQSFLADLNSKNIPVVLIDNYSSGTYPNFSHINSDDETGGYLATRYLIDHGYKKIALCTSAFHSPLMKTRCAGYKRAISEAGYEEYILTGGNMAFETGVELAETLFQQQMDAAFCTEDMLAVGVLHFLLAHDVRVGQKFGLVGFDNIGFSRQVYPELTTIDQNIFAKGETAASTLLNILKGESGVRLVLPVALVIRETA
jgi:LacI family transcriptional regulator